MYLGLSCKNSTFQTLLGHLCYSKSMNFCAKIKEKQGFNLFLTFFKSKIGIIESKLLTVGIFFFSLFDDIKMTYLGCQKYIIILTQDMTTENTLAVFDGTLFLY